MANSNYNAETAWNFLGANTFDGRGAYDYSSLPKYQRIFESIEQEPLRKQSGFDNINSLSAAIRRYTNTKNALSNVNDNALMGQILSGAVTRMAESFNNYPQAAFNNAMSGKYMGFI